jgi:hypothetical protein
MWQEFCGKKAGVLNVKAGNAISDRRSFNSSSSYARVELISLFCSQKSSSFQGLAVSSL